MKNLTKIISVIITSVFLLASFSTGAFAGKKILFSIKGPGSGNPFWASVEKGAKEEAAKLGVDLVLVATKTKSTPNFAASSLAPFSTDAQKGLPDPGPLMLNNIFFPANAPVEKLANRKTEVIITLIIFVKFFIYFPLVVF